MVMMNIIMMMKLLLLPNMHQDTFGIVPKAVLPTKEKEALKKAFGGFNAGFEQVRAIHVCGRADDDDDDDDDVDDDDDDDDDGNDDDGNDDDC